MVCYEDGLFVGRACFEKKLLQEKVGTGRDV